MRNINKEEKIGIIIAVSLILSFVIGYAGISIYKEIQIQDLYQKSRNGIFIEDKYLEHGYIEPCGDDNCARYGDGFTFNIYGKAGDMIHYHHETWNSAFDVDARIKYKTENSITSIMSVFTGYSYHSHTSKLPWTGIYTVVIHNYDMDYSGHIRVFIIVYDEYYPPDCPLC